MREGYAFFDKMIARSPNLSQLRERDGPKHLHGQFKTFLMKPRVGRLYYFSALDTPGVGQNRRRTILRTVSRFESYKPHEINRSFFVKRRKTFRSISNFSVFNVLRISKIG